MYIPYQTLAVILVVGSAAGRIAAKVLSKHGMGLAGDIMAGVIGAFIGAWLLPRLGVHFETGILLLILNAVAGAIALLLLVRLIRGV
jgi:uncharacterized membrane protein YeaQ/YmgE (transglycosylase-associated protein family)